VKVLWLTTHDRENPSTRFRVLQFLEPLRARGVESEVSHLFRADFYRRARRRGGWAGKVWGVLGSFAARVFEILRSGRYDAVVVLREVFPLGPSWLERILMWRHPRVIYDFDDAVYSRFVRAGNPLDRWRDFGKAARLIRGCRRTVAGSKTLCEYARQYSPRVELIPTVVDTEQAALRKHVAVGGAVVIGWMGTRNNLLHLALAEAALARLQAKYGVTLRVVSNAEYRPVGLRVENLTWSEAREAEHLASFDIGLMPLEDDEYSRGKCAFKLIQYLSYGIPPVCSPVGENAVVVEEGVTGFTAATPEEWYDKLERLVLDAALRQKLGTNGRERVEHRYSLRAGVTQWERLLRNLETGADA